GISGYESTGGENRVAKDVKRKKSSDGCRNRPTGRIERHAVCAGDRVAGRHRNGLPGPGADLRSRWRGGDERERRGNKGRPKRPGDTAGEKGFVPTWADRGCGQ